MTATQQGLYGLLLMFWNITPRTDVHNNKPPRGVVDMKWGTNGVIEGSTGIYKLCAE